MIKLTVEFACDRCGRKEIASVERDCTYRAADGLVDGWWGRVQGSGPFICPDCHAEWERIKKAHRKSTARARGAWYRRYVAAQKAWSVANPPPGEASLNDFMAEVPKCK